MVNFVRDRGFSSEEDVLSSGEYEGDLRVMLVFVGFFLCLQILFPLVGMPHR